MLMRLLNKSFEDRSKLDAYTLAEMLIVLLIISLVMLALPRATKKLYAVTTKAGDNGRLECYYNADGDLVKYYATSTGQSVTKTCAAGSTCNDANFTTISVTDNGVTEQRQACIFEPPKNPIYMTLVAVGGGGSGAWPAEERNGIYYVTPEQKYVVKNTIVSATDTDEKWANWLKNLYTKVQTTSGTPYTIIKTIFNQYSMSDSTKNLLYTKSVWLTKELHYAKAGKAGRVETMYFPNVPGGSTLYVVPGLGGKTRAGLESYGGSPLVLNGEAGQKTFVFMKLSSNPNPVELVTAKGGAAGIVYDANLGHLDAYVAADYITSNTRDENLHSEPGVQKKTSGFTGVMADTGGKIASKLAQYLSDNPSVIPPGDGGWGSFNLNNITLSNQFYYINDYVEHRTEVVDGRSTTKRVGDKWTNVSAGVPYPTYCNSYNLSGTVITSSIPNPESILTTVEGTCRITTLGGVSTGTCTIGNSTRVQDDTCVKSSTKSGIPQDSYCATFTPDMRLDASGECVTKAGDGNPKHCKVTKVDSKSDDTIAGSTLKRYYSYTTPTDAGYHVGTGGSGCYFDADTTSAYHNRVMCKISPESLVGNVSYIRCTLGTAPLFECPQGSKSSTICEPTDGGNGAVVLLW